MNASSMASGARPSATDHKEHLIDALRGFAALVVAYFHCRQVVWVGMQHFHRTYGHSLEPGAIVGYLTFPFAWGSAGVPIFFVISGYCIHRNAALKLAADPSYRLNAPNFWTRRFARIYPVLLAALVATLVFDSISLQIEPVSHKIRDIGLASFVVNLLSLQGVAGYTYGSNGALWTLSLEVQFYAIYPLLFAARRRFGMVPVVVAIALVNVASAWLLERHDLQFFTSYWLSWTVGAWRADARAQKITIAGKPARFELVVEDDQADPRIGVQAAQSLVDKKVSVVVGHFNSGTTIPASVVYDKAGIPVIDPAATNPVITSRGLANVFMVIATDGQNAGNAGRYAVDVTKAKRIALADERTAFGQGEADEFDKAVKAAGAAIVAREYTSNQAVDFRAQITSLKSKNVDLVFFGGLDSLAANFIKQMKQLGLNAQFVGGGGVKDAEFIKIAGPAAEGAMAWEYGRPLDQLPQGKDFESRFKKRFGVDVLSYAQFGYDATWAAIKAMQAAGTTDPSGYRPALKKIDFEGITGRISFGGDGSLKSGMSTLYQVKSGAWQTIVTKGG